MRFPIFSGWVNLKKSRRFFFSSMSNGGFPMHAVKQQAATMAPIFISSNPSITQAGHIFKVKNSRVFFPRDLPTA